MFCTNCGSKLPDDALFCPNCGAQVISDDGDLPSDLESSHIEESVDEGEKTVVLTSPGEKRDISDHNVSADHRGQDGQETVFLGNPQNPYGSTEKLNFVSEEIQREDTQAVFNDIQESLAHPEIDFEHTQTNLGLGQEQSYFEQADNEPVSGQPEPGQWTETGTAYENPGDTGFNDPGADPGAFYNENMGGIPGGPLVTPPDGDGEDQKPRQQKKFWLLLGLVSGGAVIAAVVIAMIIMFTPSGKPSEEYTEQIRQGEEYLSNSNYDDAIEAFRDAIEMDENQEDAYVGLADAYIKNQEYRKAAEVLRQGSKIAGNTDRIQEKKDELYEQAPELESEFESETAKNDPPETAPVQTNPPETQPPQTQDPVVQEPDTESEQTETTPPSQSETPDSAQDPGNVPPDTSGSGETGGESESSGSGETTPGGGETVPGGGESTPGGGETVPGGGETTPGGGESVPGGGETTPGGGETVPGDGDQDEIFTIGAFRYQMKEYYSEKLLPDGSQAFYTQITYPYFVDETEAAKGLNAYFDALISSYGSDETEYTGEEDLTFPLYEKISVEMTYGDNGFASMKCTTESYDGQNDAAVGYTGLIFNGTDGQTLTWSDVLYGTEEHLKELLGRYYDPSANNNVPAEDYMNKISENFNNAYLTGDGMRFIAYVDGANPDCEALIPFSESAWFKFLSDTDPSQPAESESESESQPTAQGFRWIVEPSMEFEDVAVIMDDSMRSQWVASNQFPLAVYQKDGKLGFVNYEGTVLTDPIYNCVYGCGSNGDAYTLFASLAGSDIWSAMAVDPQTGQASGAAHAGHGGNETVTVYSRSDQKLYALAFDGPFETSNTTGGVLPVVVVDDIAMANYDEIKAGNAVYGLCSADGVLDESHLYDHIYTLSDGRMVARSGEKYGVIDEAGNAVIPFEYDGASYLDMDKISADPSQAAMLSDAPYPYSEGYIALKKDGMWGYFDQNGTCVTGMVFEEARPVNQKKAFVKQNGLWGIAEITPEENAQ